jgi:hypothetical protein
MLDLYRCILFFFFIIEPGVLIIFEVFLFGFFPFFQFFFLVPLIPGSGFGVGAICVASGIRVNFDLGGATITLVKEHAIEIVTTNSRHYFPPAFDQGMPGISQARKKDYC